MYNQTLDSAYRILPSKVCGLYEGSAYIQDFMLQSILVEKPHLCESPNANAAYRIFPNSSYGLHEGPASMIQYKSFNL